LFVDTITLEMFEISSRIFLWEQVTAKSVGQARKWLHSDALRRAGTDLSSMTLWFFLFFSSKLRISKRDQVGLAHLARIFGISGVATVVAGVCAAILVLLSQYTYMYKDNALVIVVIHNYTYSKLAV